MDACERVATLSEPEASLLLLGVASCVGDVSFFRKDGRALRILDQEAVPLDRRDLTAERALRLVWARYEADLRGLSSDHSRIAGPGVVIQGDGRDVEMGQQGERIAGRVALMVYSPPYLNHIDYTEVYKTELSLLGFVRKQDEMLGLRQATMRSHSSVLFPGQDDEAKTLARVPTDVTEAVAATASIVEGSGSRWHLRFALQLWAT